MVILSLSSSPVIAEKQAKQQSVKHERKLAIDETNVTKHSTKVKGKKFKYTATTGTQPVWDEEGHATASLFYTYYQRSDVKDTAKRPLVISFNGGPGSASVWMHVAYTGPKVLNVDNEGYPLQPYGVKKKSILNFRCG